MRSHRESTVRRAGRAGLGLLAAALLGLGATACGSSTGRTKSTADTSPAPGSTGAGATGTVTGSSFSSSPAARSSKDRDGDFDGGKPVGYFDDDDLRPQDYPVQVGPAAMRPLTTLVKRYFAAAVADDGARACSLIYSLYAETIVETYGQPPAGPPELHGSTCAVVLSKLFRLHHGQLVAEARTLAVTGARADGNRGLVLLRFHGIPAHNLEVHRERGVWKIDDILDKEVT